MAPVRGRAEEGLARARRQRAVRRLRRRRPRRGGRRRDRLQVPQLRPDLHLREPDPRPGRDLRRVRRAAGRRRSTELKVGIGTDPDVKVGPLIEDAAVDKVERHVADAVDARGGAAHVGGERHELGQTFFQPTVLTGVTTDAAMSYEETFGPVAGIARFSDRGRGGPDRQRHAVRPRRVLLPPRRRPRLARLRGARLRDRRHQHRLRLDRGRPVRRRQGVGHRPRRLEVRHRGVARAEVPRGRRDLGPADRRDVPSTTAQASAPIRRSARGRSRCRAGPCRRRTSPCSAPASGRRPRRRAPSRGPRRR